MLVESMRKGFDNYGAGGTCTPIFRRGHYHECAPLLQQSNEVRLSACWFHGILFHQHMYFTSVFNADTEASAYGEPHPQAY